jgi:hypothetical protein
MPAHATARHPPPPAPRFCTNRDYTDVLVFNEDRKEINGMLHIHLPDGPTAQYRCGSAGTRPLAGAASPPLARPSARPAPHS